MNKRIRQLLKQSGVGDNWNTADWYSMSPEIIEKFAELIVRECAVYCEGHILPKGMAEENDLNYNDGVMDCAIGLKEHFGVEE